METREIPINMKHRRRVVAKQWQDNTDNQFEILSGNRENATNKIMLQQIRAKINGYKSQDLKKQLFIEIEFVDLEYVISLLCDCSLVCHYCRKQTVILYDKVREATQWTLDRIENNLGHNRENVVIACLSCNLSRKTMYSGRFLFTKQLEVHKTI